MDSEKDKGGRPSNEEIAIRRDKVKEMMLQGSSYREIAEALGVALSTVQADIIYWSDYFKQVGQNHPDVMRANLAKVQQTLSEIDIVKKQYWDAYKKLLEEQKEQEEYKKKWREELQQMKLDYQTAVENKNREEMRRLTKLIKEQARMPRLPSLHRAQLDNLKLIMDRIDKEAKLLNLFNPAIGQGEPQNALSWDTFKAVMIVFKQIILDFIPQDQREYAFQRLRRVKLDKIRPEDIVDAQIVPEPPKVGLTRIEAPEVAPEPEKQAPEAPVVEKKAPVEAPIDDKGLEDLDI